MNIAVIGTGSWGTALAKVLNDSGQQVIMWGRNQATVDEINHMRTNHMYLSDFVMDPAIEATTDLEKAVISAEMILIVLPTKAIRTFAQKLRPILMSKALQPILVHATKGLEHGSKLRISQVLAEELGNYLNEPVAVLSGPSHAEEVAREDITVVTAASSSLEIARKVQSVFMNNYFRVYSNTDIIGVELGGALKNIIALASGVLSGSNYGDNARAALMTRGLAEITRLGVALGSDPLTFSGLSGVGDLIVTCTSQHSRNFKAGYLLAQGKKKETVDQEVQMVVEGFSTCKVAYEIAEELGIDMPITAGLYQLIYEAADVTETVTQLMEREGKQEASLGHYEQK